MKTRIVYPQLWLDEKFFSSSLETKVLFNYLINNIYLGLSRYVRISSRKIKNETGLSDTQLETAKSELTQLRWCYFYEEWIYHSHDCAYVDYQGNSKVTTARDKELSQIPQKVKEVVNGLLSGREPLKQSTTDQSKLKGSVTGHQPNINHKSKTINHKPETSEGFVSGIELMRESLRAKGLQA